MVGKQGPGAQVTPWKQGSLPRLQNTICAVPPMELGWGRRAWRGRGEQRLKKGWSLNGESDTSVSTCCGQGVEAGHCLLVTGFSNTCLCLPTEGELERGAPRTQGRPLRLFLAYAPHLFSSCFPHMQPGKAVSSFLLITHKLRGEEPVLSGRAPGSGEMSRGGNQS